MKIKNIADLGRYPFPDNIKRQIIDAFREKKNGCRAADSASHLEPASCHESVRTHAGEAFDSPVRIDIYSRRKTKTDIDNISGKAALDGIVAAGILKDDSPDWIESYCVHKPEICEKEETVIVIEEA